MSIVRTTVDDKLFHSANDILSTLGLDMNGAVRMFLQGVVLHNGIPFDLRLTAEQAQATTEVHEISGSVLDAAGTGSDCSGPANRCGSDLIEARSTLEQRHAECTDCHNPHRVIRNRLFNANPQVADAAGTHRHDETTGYTHTNLASGVLRGAWGVEPAAVIVEIRPGIMKEWLRMKRPMRVVPERSKFIAAISEP